MGRGGGRRRFWGRLRRWGGGRRGWFLRGRGGGRGGLSLCEPYFFPSFESCLSIFLHPSDLFFC